jgi:hypothetical protein
VSDRVSLVLALILACTGVAMLARLDIPLLLHGGTSALLATLDLTTAVSVIVLAVWVSRKPGGV